jgi:hypothetical protein
MKKCGASSLTLPRCFDRWPPLPSRRSDRRSGKKGVDEINARSWIKRGLIKNAIAIVSPASAGSSEKRNVWSVWQHRAGGHDEIGVVT